MLMCSVDPSFHQLRSRYGKLAGSLVEMALRELDNPEQLC